MRNLRHGSLQMNVLYMYLKFYAWEMVIRGDILDQKIKVKKSIFKLPTPSCFFPLTNVHITCIFKDSFLLVI